MLDRRSFVLGAVAMAAPSFVVRVATAQAGRPMLVFVGDQTSEDCKVWRTQWEPLFVASPVYKKLDYRVIYPERSAMLSK